MPVDERQRMLDRLAHLRQEVRHLKERLGLIEDERRATDDEGHYDPLTGLFNRKGMEDEIDREFERSRRHGTTLSMISFDVDRLEVINREKGREAGDAVLLDVSAILSEIRRSYDVAGRWAEDEFVLLLSETEPRQAADVAERILRVTRKPSGKITLSAGLSSTNTASGKRELVAQARAALERAKSFGGNHVSIWTRILEDQPLSRDLDHVDV